MIVLVAAMIFQKHKKSSDEEVSARKISEDVKITDLGILDGIEYVEIKKHSSTYSVAYSGIIDELVNKISLLEIEPEKESYLDLMPDYTNKSSYHLTGYNNSGKDKKLVEIVFISNSFITIDSDNYVITSEGDIYDYLAELCEYCVVPLPDLIEGSIFKYECSEELGELSKTEVFEFYNSIKDSRPVSEEEFKNCEGYEKYLSIETVNNEFIDFYMVSDTIYITYKEKNVSITQTAIDAGVGKEWKTECYFAMEKK